MTKEQKVEEKKKDKYEKMDLGESSKSKTNYHALAEDVANTTKNNFEEFEKFLGAYLEINMEKFGVVNILDHLLNVERKVRLIRLGVIKAVKDETN